MRTYEVIFILKPDLPEEETGAFITQMETLVTTGGGTVKKLDKMGQRRLAYNVGRYRDGQYVLFSIECDVATIKEFERRLRVSEPVIKFQTVRTDEETKRLEKLQAIRAKKLARKKPKRGSSTQQGSSSEPAAASA